jgi:allantoate deiminase
MKDLLGACVGEAGYEVLELVSGAGHDAVPISAVSPVCMLFVRCYKGISHNPLESVEKKDLAAAIRVAESFVYRLTEI